MDTVFFKSDVIKLLDDVIGKVGGTEDIIERVLKSINDVSGSTDADFDFAKNLSERKRAPMNCTSKEVLASLYELIGERRTGAKELMIYLCGSHLMLAEIITYAQIHGTSGIVILRTSDGVIHAEKCRILSTDSELEVDGDLIFIPCSIDNYQKLEFIKLFDSWYKNSDKNRAECAVEFHVFVSMLLGRTEELLLANPKKITITGKELQALQDVLDEQMP